MPHHRSRLTTFWLPWVLLSLLSTLWALATPLSGSPDEPAHVIKAASVVRGELLPEYMVPQGGVVEVPVEFAWELEQSCFAFKPDKDASCAPVFDDDPALEVLAPTPASLYNPLYYWIVGWPSLIAPDTVGIFAMRILSGVFTTFFLAAAFRMIAGWPRIRVPALGALVALTPMVLYLSATVNPNALEFTAGLALFVAMLGVVLHPSPHRLVPRLAIVVVASVLVSNARGISPLWVAVLLAAPLILLKAREVLALLRRRAVIVSIALIALGALASAWWTLSSNSLGTGPSTGPDVAPPNEGVGTSALGGFVGQLGNMYEQSRQMVGVFGWLDTVLHPLAYPAYFALFALVAVVVAIFVRGRALVFTIVLALAFLLLPAIVQAVYVTRGGFIWQGRYTLVLLVALVLGAAAVTAVSPRFARFEAGRAARIVIPVVSVAIAGVWLFANIIGFAVALRRFASGYTSFWADMVGPNAWQPPLGVVPLIVLFGTVAVAFAATVLVVFRDTTRSVAAVGPRD
jgi:hypothetical protein